MAIGEREQPEKFMFATGDTYDKRSLTKQERRRSRKHEKQMQNRKLRRLAKQNPEVPPQPKYCGWEW